jgi:hypothetical protein
MVVGLLVGVSVTFVFLFFIAIALIVVNHKSNSTIKDEVRGLTEAVKKMSEAIVAMKEVVQFVHTKNMLNESLLNELVNKEQRIK